MIFDKFKSKNIIKQFKKALNNPLKNDAVYSNKINNVLLFVENDVDQGFIISLSKNLKIDISDICLFKFKLKEKKNDDCKNCISKRDFGVFGKLANKYIKSIIEKPYDLVISLTRNNEFISNLVANSNTGFKVGLLDDYSQVYDLTISVESGNLLAFNSELEKYLKILNKL